MRLGFLYFWLAAAVFFTGSLTLSAALDVQKVSDEFFPAITAVSFLPQNDSLVLIAQSSESWDSTKFFIRNVYTGAQNQVFYPSTKIRVGYMFLSPSGKYLAFIGDSLGNNPRLCIVDMQTGQIVHRQFYAYGNLSFSPDEKSIAYIVYLQHEFYKLYITNFATDHTDNIHETGLSDPTDRPNQDATYDVKFSPDGKSVYFNTYYLGLLRFDLETEKCNSITNPAEGNFTISSDNRYLAYTSGMRGSVNDTSYIIIRNLPDYSVYQLGRGDVRPINIFFTSNNRYCAFIGGSTGKLYLCDLLNKSVDRSDLSIGGPIGGALSSGLKWYVQGGGGQHLFIYKIDGDYNGIQETPNSNEVNVAPNPAGNDLNVIFSAEQSGLYTFSIISNDCRTIQTTSTSLSATGEQTIAMQTGNLPAGAYFLQVNSNNFNAIKRIIINH